MLKGAAWLERPKDVPDQNHLTGWTWEGSHHKNHTRHHSLNVRETYDREKKEGDRKRVWELCGYTVDWNLIVTEFFCECSKSWKTRLQKISIII